ncbi:hypothetical protein [Synechococcus phage Yong-L1-251]|nr:hypothetical protein [Synechococcus phage Yong-L1-251]
MATLKLVVDQQNYAGPSIGYAPAVMDGLQVWHFPKLTAAQSVKNYPDGDPSTIIGSPTFNNNSIRTTGGDDHIQTVAAETEDFTVLAVARAINPGAANSARPAIGGNLTLNTSGFGLIYGDLNGNEVLQLRRTVDSPLVSTNVSLTVATSGAGEITNYNFSGARNKTSGSDAEQAVFFRNASTDVSETLSISGRPVVLGAGNITAGGLADLYDGELDIAFFAYYNRALSDVEIDAVYKQVRAYLSARNGIEV